MGRKKKEVEDTTPVELSKDEARRELKNRLNKEAGERLIGSLKEEAVFGMNVVSTGLPSLDIKLGGGGIPRGRITEIYGPNQAGKTTLALQIAANVYRSGGAVIYVDAEYALDVPYALMLGLDVADPDRFLLVQPGYGEEAFNALWKFLKNGLVDLVVIDSYPMMVPYAAVCSAEEKGFEKIPAVALSARMWGFFLDKAIKYIKRNDVAFLILNQERVVQQGPGLGIGRAGGNVLKHIDFVCVQLTSAPSSHKGEGDKQKGTYIGKLRSTVAMITKNKMAAPYQQVLFDIVFGKGIDYYKDLIEVCLVYEAGVQASGTWISFIDSDGQEIRKIQGIDKASNFLEATPELLLSMLDKLEVATGIRIFNPQRPLDKIGRAGTELMVEQKKFTYKDLDEEELFTEEQLVSSLEDSNYSVLESDIDPAIEVDEINEFKIDL
jgi:recombination protein RecA